MIKEGGGWFGKEDSKDKMKTLLKDFDTCIQKINNLFQKNEYILCVQYKELIERITIKDKETFGGNIQELVEDLGRSIHKMKTENIKQKFDNDSSEQLQALKGINDCFSSISDCITHVKAENIPLMIQKSKKKKKEN